MISVELYTFLVAAFAEFCASLMYLLLGCMGWVQTPIFANYSLQKGFNMGLIVMGCYQTFECISGAHLNPVITIAALINGSIDWRKALAYIPCQFIGAFAGYALTWLALPDEARNPPGNRNNFCTTIPEPDLVSPVTGLFLEFFLTACWVYAMLSVWHVKNDSNRDSVSMRVGLIVGSLTIIGNYFTGASMNPARTLPPAVLNNRYDSIWIYFAGPIAAALIVAAVWRFFYLEENFGKMLPEKKDGVVLKKEEQPTK